jgi:hypothetical protein
MTTYQLSGRDFNWKLTGANNFESAHNYVYSVRDRFRSLSVT